MFKFQNNSALFIDESGKALEREFFISKLKHLLGICGYNPQSFNRHSFRIGAATTAGKSNIEDHLTKTLGRWNSNSYCRYIRTSKNEIVPKFLDSLTDEERKKETKTEAKNDALSSIIKALKQLVSRLPDQEETIKNLEIFRLNMILRLLQISSFNGKMNALNEVNKLISMISNVSSRHSSMDEDEWLTAEKMADWVQNNQVLTIVLRDSLHQPQYVEKPEKILRFMIKEKALTSEDLDKLWEAQSGKHDAIVKNVHDLCSQDRDQQKMTWIGKFVEKLKNDKWMLPALKQIRDICQLFPEASQNFPHASPRTPHVYYRNNVINQLQSTHSIVMLVAKNLSEYMEKSRVFAKEHPDLDPATILPDGRFNHVIQIQERLKFMRFVL
ncbi:USP9_24 [Mytilus coruscus]|uniref:USP9_24 n=1 Tax=Mytilus coruscus TaxID=42192 RepID=A0A6J8ENW6_MYTCO|nr:USP9_24 [Mytilus coruscus]